MYFREGLPTALPTAMSTGFKTMSCYYIEAGPSGSQFSHLWNGADGGPAQVFDKEHSDPRGVFRVSLDSKLLDVSIPESQALPGSSFGFLVGPISMFWIYTWESKVMDGQLGVALP